MTKRQKAKHQRDARHLETINKIFGGIIGFTCVGCLDETTCLHDRRVGSAHCIKKITTASKADIEDKKARCVEPRPCDGCAAAVVQRIHDKLVIKFGGTVVREAKVVTDEERAKMARQAADAAAEYGLVETVLNLGEKS